MKLNTRGKVQLILIILILFIIGLIKVYKTVPVYGANILDINISYETTPINEPNSPATCGNEVIAYKKLMEEPTYDIAEEIVRPYDDETVEVLTNLLYGEARGIKPDSHKAAVIWCVLNRYDTGNYGNSIIAVATAKNQFCGYVKGRVYKDEDSYKHCKNIVIDVLDRYYTEEQVGRVLPKDYLYFVAKDGKNVFTKTWKGTNYWDWSLDSPYDK